MSGRGQNCYLARGGGLGGHPRLPKGIRKDVEGFIQESEKGKTQLKRTIKLLKVELALGKENGKAGAEIAAERKRAEGALALLDQARQYIKKMESTLVQVGAARNDATQAIGVAVRERDTAQAARLSAENMPTELESKLSEPAPSLVSRRND